jgi:hypothetical protein
MLDILVLSLSLMGVNWIDYLKEDFRLTKTGVQLMISEPQNRWADEKMDSLIDGLKESGFLMVGDPQDRNKFLYM